MPADRISEAKRKRLLAKARKLEGAAMEARAQAMPECMCEAVDSPGVEPPCNSYAGGFVDDVCPNCEHMHECHASYDEDVKENLR